MRFFAIGLLLSCVPSWATPTTNSASASSWDEFAHELARERALNPNQSYDYWESVNQFNLELEDRVLDLTPGLALLARNYMDYFFSFGEENRQALPVSESISSELRADIHLAIKSLPVVVKEALKPYLAGIVFVRNMRVNGLAALMLRDSDHRQMGGLIYINLDTIDAKINDWWSWKESSPFYDNSKENSFVLQAMIDRDPDQNTRIRALQFILLHELGHILGYGGNHFPRWDIPLEQPYQIGDYPYLDISWRLEGKVEVQRDHEAAALGRFSGKFKYFRPTDEGRLLANSDMPRAYAALEESGFITPYATLHPHEDFAELFTIHVMSKFMGVKPSVEIFSHSGHSELVYSLHGKLMIEPLVTKTAYIDQALVR